MPIEVDGLIRALDQSAFGEIAYTVMEHAFRIHDEFGRFFDEGAYERALADAFGERATTETRIRVIHGDFCKPYRIDLMVDQGAIFELKTVDELAGQHRAQLLNYLLLTECRHGKLINFRPDRVEHEFVNTTLSKADRTAFEIDDSGWDRSSAKANHIRQFVEGILRDWGTCLELQLYVDALTHFLGGEEHVIRDIDVVHEDRRIGRQKARLIDDETTFKFTALTGNLDDFESHVVRFLKHTRLKHVLWINVTLKTVSFKTVSV